MDRSPGLGGKACIRVSTPSQQVSKWLRALGDCCRVCWPPGGVSLQNGALLFLPLVYPVHSSWCSSRRRVPTLPLTLPTLPWTSHLTPTWKSFDKVHKISIRAESQRCWAHFSRVFAHLSGKANTERTKSWSGIWTSVFGSNKGPRPM
jgi:hypothetical protein